MANDALDTEYENGVADVLAFVAGSSATIERNVRLPGLRSHRKRQIDVLITTSAVGMGTYRVVVDCKRWKKTIDIPDVQGFYGLVQDVGVDGGLLITTSGASTGALEWAKQEVGLRIDVLTLEELAKWRPPGTVHFDYDIPIEKETIAARKVRRAGFRVALLPHPEQPNGTVTLSAFQHFGDKSPSGEVQIEARERVLIALKQAGVDDPKGRASGIVVDGGTPGHRWIQTTLAGENFVKVLASSEEELSSRLDHLAEGMLGHLPTARALLSFIKPEDWPVEGLFTGWGR